MGGPGGRKKDDCWKQVIELGNGKVRCKYCEHEFVGGATRIKSHLSGTKNGGVQVCTKNRHATNNSIKCDETRNLEDTTNLCSGSPILGVVSNRKNLEEIAYSGIVEGMMRSKVGPFSVLNESLLINYVFDSSLDQSEIIFSSTHSYLKRSEFTTLRPKGLLDSLVIDIFSEHLTDIERKKQNMLLNWYLPTFSTWAFSGDTSSIIDHVKSQKMREKHMSNLENCDKMFIPVHIEKNSHGHFYLYAIHLKNAEVQIWDSLPGFIHENEHEERTKKLLVALDKLFEDDIRDNRRAFSNFHVAMAKDARIQPNEYDCGIFVIKVMQQSADATRDPSFQFHSDQERLDLALELLKSDINQERLSLIRKAAEAGELRQQNDIEGGHLCGIKRMDSNMSVGVFEGVQEAASVRFNDSISSKRLKSIDSLSHAEKSLDNLNSPKGYTKGLPLPTSPDLMVRMLEKNTEQVLEWLMEDKVSVIGVWGMGGIGKTTLATHIHNQLLEGDYGFDHVIWVTVSQEYSISEMQKNIAKSIDADISGEIGEKRVAARLFQAFKRIKKCVLILDDVWDHIFLEQVGVPVSNNGIKLILTTRSLDVCQSMNCNGNIVQLHIQCPLISWDLFRKTLIGDHGTLPSGIEEIEEIAEELWGECGGLPLAIVRVATSMRGKENIRVWRLLLENLKDGQIDMKRWVFPILRSSYDHLIDEKLQKCFLYCALYPSEFIYKPILIRNFVCEGLINETRSLVAQIDEGYSILLKLINASLVEEDFKISVNSIVRGMAVSIAKENHWHNLIRHDQEWSEDVQKVFLLMDEDIQEIPFGISPKCPKLSSLVVTGKRNLRLMADDFFINMPALRVLDLSHTAIERLPTSVSNLECLVALLLSRCRSLSYVPPLAQWRRLMWLDLSFSGVTQLPLGLELAINLRSLDLRGADQLKMSTSSAIAKLSNLQSLYLPRNPESVIVKAKDLQGLKKLEAVLAHFRDIEEYNKYVRSLRDRGRPLTNYLLTLGDKPDLEPCHDFPFNDNGNAIKLVKFVSVELENSAALLPQDVDRVQIRECHQWRCLCHVLSREENDRQHLLEISNCEIDSCDKLEYLFCCLPSCSLCTSFLWIDKLVLKDLDCLSGLSEGTTLRAPMALLNPGELLSYLKVIQIYGCKRIRRLPGTPLSLSAEFKNSKRIKVGECVSPEEIFPERTSDEVQGSSATFPILKSVELVRLSNLNSVFKGIKLVEFQNLKRIVIKDCVSLEEIFSVRKSKEEQGISAHVQTITLFKLESVELVRLPKLNSIFKGTMLICHSLQRFDIFYCPNLKDYPQIHPPFEINIRLDDNLVE